MLWHRFDLQTVSLIDDDGGLTVTSLTCLDRDRSNALSNVSLETRRAFRVALEGVIREMEAGVIRADLDQPVVAEAVVG